MAGQEMKDTIDKKCLREERERERNVMKGRNKEQRQKQETGIVCCPNSIMKQAFALFSAWTNEKKIEQYCMWLAFEPLFCFCAG